MGLFDKKENVYNEEIKTLENVKKVIDKNRKLDEDDKQDILKYIDETLKLIEENKTDEIDFNIRFLTIFLEKLESSNASISDYLDYKKMILKANDKTDDYAYLKEMFLDRIIGPDGYVNNNIFDKEFYVLFNNKHDYFDIMDIINTNELYRERFEDIVKYAHTIVKYMTSNEMFRAELLSYIMSLEDVVYDYNTYTNECIESIQKRFGEYHIDEKEVALLNTNVDKIANYLEIIKRYEARLSKEEDKLKNIIKNGKEEIKLESSSTLNTHLSKLKELMNEIEILSTNEKKEIKTTSSEIIGNLNKGILEEKKEIIKKLDERLEELEIELKDKSDQVFNEILIQYKKEVEDFKTMIKLNSKTTTKDLLEIKKTADESIQKLKDVITNDKQIKEFIATAKEEVKVRDELLEIMQKQSDDVSSIKTNVIIPGSDRIVVPATPQIVIPDVAINSKVIDIFNEKISFQKRMETILKKKEKAEKQGQIYHEKTEEIIRCIIEGDWVYLWGPSGCGKSYLMTQISELLGLELVKNGKIGEPYTVMGYYDPQGNFRATQTYIALVYGKLLAYDEFDNGNADTQVAINEIYSKFLDSIEKPDKKHYVTFAEDVPALINPNFRMISAGNTSGEGENPLYSSRSKIDESVQERMTAKFIKYDNRVEEKIFGDYKEWYNFFCDFRKSCDNYAKQNGQESVPGIATTRDAAAITKYIKNNSKSLSQVVAEKFVQTKNSEYREELGRFIANLYNLDYSNVQYENDPSDLKHVKAKVIAKKFIYQCKNGVN